LAAALSGRLTDGDAWHALQQQRSQIGAVVGVMLNQVDHVRHLAGRASAVSTGARPWKQDRQGDRRAETQDGGG
jgi:hypothetical protein